jgi:GR25 family glycosyltransferase involved in LPS biosynthesis
MRSFVINLNRRPDRYERFCSEMALPSCTRVSAVDSRDIVWTDELRARVCDWNFEHIPLIVKNVVACCLSHLAVWETVRTLDVPCVAVFEDDAAWIQGSFDLDALSFPSEFGLIWLNNLIQDGRHALTPAASPAAVSNVSVIPHSHYQYTTEGYIITPAFAGRLCSEIAHYLGAVDAHMAQVISKVENESGGTVAFQVWPPLVCQFDRSDTDVQR